MSKAVFSSNNSNNKEKKKERNKRKKKTTRQQSMTHFLFKRPTKVKVEHWEMGLVRDVGIELDL